jgi:hypothetical protein
LHGLDTTASASSVTLLVTLRADFMGQALAHPLLAQGLRTYHPAILGPMAGADLHAAIEKPAATQGVTLEAGLTQRILQDLGQEPGHLPLLEFALTQLWERRHEGTLTHAAGRSFQLGEGWHSNANAGRFWNSSPRVPKETPARC